jgi:hypothetical protein
MRGQPSNFHVAAGLNVPAKPFLENAIAKLAHLSMNSP